MRARAQFVLLAAAVFAVALVPVVTAYYTLGYHGDVHESGPTVEDATVGTLETALGRATRNASDTGWADRNRTAEDVRRAATTALPAIRNATLAGNLSVGFDAPAARNATENHCPNGAAKRFGDCAAHRGIILQNRSGRTHVVGATVHLEWTGVERSGDVTLFVRPDVAGAYSESRSHSSARRVASSRARS